MIPKLGGVALPVLICGLLLAMPAYGYIDSNATSLLTQVLTPVLMIAAALGWLAGRLHRRKR